MRTAQEARTISKYGLRGSRVGEASNPGPLPSFRRLRWPVSIFLGWRALGSPNMGRDVLPRVGGEGCSTVSPTVSPAPNMDAIQQTLVDTASLAVGASTSRCDQRVEADLVGNVAWDPISAVRGPRHQGAS